jgi:hypothetical protein
MEGKMSSIKMSKRWYNEKYKQIYEEYNGKYEDLVDAYIHLLWELEFELGT